jgi:glycosyltransferase involved in cell wall biosynthesis
VIYTIIPCFNEVSSIEKVLNAAVNSDTDKVLVVDNGSTDGSTDVIKNYSLNKVDLLYFNTPLGHDIPKAAGLFYSLLDKGEHFIFVDGDMIGVNSKDINSIILSLKSGLDLSLTDCYYDGTTPSGLAQYVLHFREILNSKLNLFDKIKYSTPSHVPHGISKKLAASLPLEYTAIPPLLLSYAAKNNFNIDIGLKKLHKDMVDDNKSSQHALTMCETLIGDCISGLSFIKDKPLIRKYKEIDFVGYHRNRRFDILEMITKKKISF